MKDMQSNLLGPIASVIHMRIRGLDEGNLLKFGSKEKRYGSQASKTRAGWAHRYFTRKGNRCRREVELPRVEGEVIRAASILETINHCNVKCQSCIIETPLSSV
jgi:hypothetical protein